MSTHDAKHFRMEKNDDGVTTVTLDVVDRPVNVLDDEVLEELEALVTGLEHDPDTRVVVFTSGKRSGFLAGADVARIRSVTSTAEAEEISARGQRLFDRIERLTVPTVAVIHGPCLGGGLEFALACRYRLARDDDATQLGLPEVQLGILPAWGGTQRLPEVVGIPRALEMILQGKKISARKAARYRLVDAAYPPEEFTERVADFVKQRVDDGNSVGDSGAEKRENQSPASHPSLGNKLLEGTPFGRWTLFRIAHRRVASSRKHYPALGEIIEAVERGVSGSREKGLAYEREALGRLLFSSTCRNLLGIFFERERARKDGGLKNGSLRVLDGTDVAPIKKIAVIGAGVMGAGIAQVAAYRGFSVVLKDLNSELTAAGLKQIDSLFDKAVENGQLRRDEADARRANVSSTTQWAALSDVDLVIEAVVEREDIKRSVFADLDKHLPAGALLVSNTSALSIEHLAEVTHRLTHVAGLHFFNPPHKMQLIEVVRAGITSDATLARLVEFARRLGKVPVVVRDSPGFLVNRVLLPYLGESLRLVCEGVSPATIDREIRRFGNPMGPLELLDAIGIDVATQVTRSLSLFVDNPLPAVSLLDRMVKNGWLGKKTGRGFYHYQNGRRTKPADLETGDSSGRWQDYVSETMRLLGKTRAPRQAFPIRTRLIHLLINEAARCLGEGVVSEPGMVDLAMVLGTGFAPFHGGPLRLVDAIGIERVAQQLEAMRQGLGERFAPCATLRQMSEQHREFYSAATEKASHSTLEPPQKAE